MITRPVALVLLASAAVVAGQSQPPYLFLRLNTPHGLVTLAPDRSTEVPNNQRISLQICVKARTIADQFEQPEIRALNQHSDYYKVRPPADVTLSVRRVTASSHEEVPFRVYSSGGGKDLAIYHVSADIDLLEDKDVRLKRAGQFVEWMAAQVPEDSRARLLTGPIGTGGLIAYFEEQYINNPPGDYEIIARYTPSTPQNWTGSLVTSALRIKVTDNGDFFDGLKAKLAAGNHSRASRSRTPVAPSAFRYLNRRRTLTGSDPVTRDAAQRHSAPVADSTQNAARTRGHVCGGEWCGLS
jgi:hypothetical protein